MDWTAGATGNGAWRKGWWMRGRLEGRHDRPGGLAGLRERWNLTKELNNAKMISSVKVNVGFHWFE